jgi:amidase
MSRHLFQPKVFHNAIGLGDPVQTVDDGDTIVTQTVDAWGFDEGTNRLRSGRIL